MVYLDIQGTQKRAPMVLFKPFALTKFHYRETLTVLTKNPLH